MTLDGHVENGAITSDEIASLPDGTRVKIEVLPPSIPSRVRPRRRGGWWKGQVQISDDFDDLPADIAQALGMTHE